MRIKIPIILAALILSLSGIVSGQVVQKCFSNSGLKDKHTVYLTINGNKVQGEFIVEKEYETSETYKFNGTILKNNLTIGFVDNKFPYELPPKTKKGSWTLKKADDVESLLIKIYGKNSANNKYSTYSATYNSCEPSYETLFKKATRISFAKGATSAMTDVMLQDQSDRKAFLLNLGKGQKFSVFAPGCAISLYYPNKMRDEEGGIDTWGSDSLPQSGDYLFVFSMAGELNKCNVKFATE